MRVVVTGASGFIGKAVCKELAADYEVIGLTRDIEKGRKVFGDYATAVEWDGRTSAGWESYLEGAAGVINLAGENVASGRWTTKKMDRIRQSRVDSSRAVIEAIEKVKVKPSMVIQSSAIGYYGPPRGDEALDENSSSGEGFLAEVCRKVEGFAEEIERLKVRCVVIRTGMVLDAGGGALPKFARPFRYYVGGCPGDGKQWVSWISLADEMAAIRFLMENDNASGVFNLTAPGPVRMKEFCSELGRIMRRPVLLRIPKFAVRLGFGKIADELILAGQRVLPRRMLESGFSFKHENIKQALSDMID